VTADAAAVERATLRKIAWRLLPLIALGYGISYVDRVNISFAALQMNEDLGFSATVYGLGGGLFFLSYALLEVPSNMILARVGARRWIARIMVTWGALAMAMALVRTPTQFYVMRFLLGAAEAGFFPGVLYYITLWFPEAHRAKAVTGFYFAVPLSSALMGGMAGPLLGLDGRAGLEGWQWLFLVQGAPAVLLSVAILFALPESPAKAAWLSGEEKAWLARRLAADAAGRIGAEHSILRALAHPTVLALVAVNFLMLGSNYAFSLSAPTIVREATGLSAGSIGNVAVLGNLLGVAAMLTIGWNSDRTGQRHLHVAGPLLAVAAALGAISLTDSPAVMIGAYVVFLASATTAASQFFLTPGAILHPRAAAVGVAAINALGQLGSFALPALWGVARDATGSYHLGLAGLAANFALAAAIVLLLRRQMKRRPLAAAEPAE
jgi:ACS family tartrate transporter-like MFS transporter